MSISFAPGTSPIGRGGARYLGVLVGAGVGVGDVVAVVLAGPLAVVVVAAGIFAAGVVDGLPLLAVVAGGGVVVVAIGPVVVAGGAVT